MTGLCRESISKMNNIADQTNSLVLVLPLNSLGFREVVHLEKLIQSRLKHVPHFEQLDSIVDNLFHNLSKTFLVSVKDQKISTSLFDCTETPQYRSSMQTCIDSFIYEVSKTGVNLSFEEAHEIVQRAELAMIEEICAFIPDFDEEYMVIATTAYTSRYNFYMMIQKNPEFKLPYDSISYRSNLPY